MSGEKRYVECKILCPYTNFLSSEVVTLIAQVGINNLNIQHGFSRDLHLEVIYKEAFEGDSYALFIYLECSSKRRASDSNYSLTMPKLQLAECRLNHSHELAFADN